MNILSKIIWNNQKLPYICVTKQTTMKPQQLQTMLQLHRKAVTTLSLIQSSNEDIARTQDRLVLLSKDPTQTTRTRAYHEDTLLDLLQQQRKLRDMHVEQYANIAQQLAEPFVPKESYLVTTYEMVSL